MIRNFVRFIIAKKKLSFQDQQLSLGL
jgi:hypothetical protein